MDALQKQFTYAAPDRGHWLGATDIVALAGFSHWRAPIAVWQEKTRELNRDKPGAAYILPLKEENVLLDLGLHVEPFLASRYRSLTDFSVMRTSPLRHKYVDYWACSPDFLVAPNDTHTDRLAFPDVTHGLETKLVVFGGQRPDELDTWGTEGTDEIPQDYLIQCQWSMNVTGLPRWDVAVLWHCTAVRLYVVSRNETLITRLREIADDFWHNNVLADKPPKPDGSREYNRHLVQSLPRRDLPVNYDLDNDPAYEDSELRAADLAIVDACIASGRTLKEAETQRNLAWQEFVVRFGNRARVKAGGVHLTSRVQSRKYTDWQKVARSFFPDLPQERIDAAVVAASTESEPYLVTQIRRAK